MTEQKIPRGIRNKNPGNIERSSKFTWEGEDELSYSSAQFDHRFATFVDPVWGVRAMMKLLINYNQKREIKTLRQAISRYAPSFENKTDVYTKFVADKADVKPDDEWDFTQRFFLIPVVKAMVCFENGYPSQEQLDGGAVPFQWYPDKVYNDAYELALKGRITSHTFNEVVEAPEEEKPKTKRSFWCIIRTWLSKGD